MATIQQKMTKKGLKASFVESFKRKYQWKPFSSHLMLAREYQEQLRKVFMPLYRNKANFSSFSLLKL